MATITAEQQQALDTFVEAQRRWETVDEIRQARADAILQAKAVGVTGAEMADAAGVPRITIWKMIETLGAGDGG